MYYYTIIQGGVYITVQNQIRDVRLCTMNSIPPNFSWLLKCKKKYFILTLEKKWSNFCFSCITSAPLLLRIAVNDPLKRRNILYDCCKTARYTLSWTSSLWYSQYSVPSFTLTTNGIFTVWKQIYKIKSDLLTAINIKSVFLWDMIFVPMNQMMSHPRQP